MLRHAHLVSLERSVRNEPILTVYVGGDIADAGTRGQWRIALRNELDAVESSLTRASHTERERFAKARRLSEEHVNAYGAGPDAPGWMGVFSPNGVLHTGVMPVPVPTIARWQLGVVIGPDVRALKETHPVLVVIADSTRVRILRYVERNLTLLDVVDRVAHVDAPHHMSAPPRAGFHQGTHGRAGADAAQRELRKATDALLADAAARIAQLASDGAWIVLGGIPGVAAALRPLLPETMTGRTAITAIDVHATPTDLATAARTESSALRNKYDLSCIDEAVAAAAIHGNGAANIDTVERALTNGQVRDLFLTTGFMRDHEARAESFIRRAFDEGATVEHVSGPAAERLDRIGGIAARLRFSTAAAATSRVFAGGDGGRLSGTASLASTDSTDRHRRNAAER